MTPKVRAPGRIGRWVPFPGQQARAKLAALTATQSRKTAARADPASRVSVLVALIAAGLGLIAVPLPVSLLVVPGVALAAWWIIRLLVARGILRWPSAPEDPAVTAANWDLLAACLRAGLPIPTALRSAAGGFTDCAAVALFEVADRLALGAAPHEAWESALHRSVTADLARAARRSARAGTGLAEAAADLAQQSRSELGNRAEARAQRAGVLVSAPLGLCFLPAFLCLGVLPVVVGLAKQVSSTW